jgi:hypothetical protein
MMPTLMVIVMTRVACQDGGRGKGRGAGKARRDSGGQHATEGQLTSALTVPCQSRENDKPVTSGHEAQHHGRREVS